MTARRRDGRRREHRDRYHGRRNHRRRHHSGNFDLIFWVGLFLFIVWLADHYGT